MTLSLDLVVFRERQMYPRAAEWLDLVLASDFKYRHRGKWMQLTKVKLEAVPFIQDV